MLGKEYFSKDIFDFLVFLNKKNVKYAIIGGEAVIYYGYARLTGDIDIYYSTDKDNIERLWEVLLDFWENDIPGMNSLDVLARKGSVFQFGVPPNRIDLINEIDGVEFSEVWQNIVKEEVNSVKNEIITINIIGIKELIKNKQKSNRNKDKDDLKYLKSCLKIKK